VGRTAASGGIAVVGDDVHVERSEDGDARFAVVSSGQNRPKLTLARRAQSVEGDSVSVGERGSKRAQLPREACGVGEVEQVRLTVRPFLLRGGEHVEGARADHLRARELDPEVPLERVEAGDVGPGEARSDSLLPALAGGARVGPGTR
jgi:hypothetical protein